MGHDGHVLRLGQELHHIIIEGAVEGRKPPGIPRNSYIHVSRLKKDAGFNTCVGLKRLSEDREKWRTKLNVANQNITG